MSRLFTEGTAHCAWLPARSALPSFLQMIPPILLNSSVPRRVSNKIAFILLTDESCALRRIRQRSSRRPQRSGNVSLIKENISSPSAGYCLPAPFRMSPPSVMDPCLTSHSGEYSKEKVRVSPHHPAKERSDQLFLSQKVKVSPDADFIQVIYPCRAPASACSHLKSILREHSR